MATEIAVTSGTGTIVLDVRRGDGPAGCFDYTMSAPGDDRAADREIARNRRGGAARAGRMRRPTLKADVSRATEVGEKRFPPRETGLIAQIVARDLPYYDAAISEKSVAGDRRLRARSHGILDENVPYGDIVATQFSHLWRAGA